MVTVCIAALLIALVATTTGSPVQATEPPPGDSLTFHVSGLGPTIGGEPNWSSFGAAALTDPLPHDREGVRLFRVNGQLRYQPSAEAAYGIANLNAWRATGDRRFLVRATAQARRLVRARVEYGNTWFFPFTYDFPLHAGTVGWTQHAPWYSAMTQGHALSLFTYLYVVTHNEYWHSAADATFRSLLVRPSRRHPWVVHTDNAGYLWLAEYPRPGGESDRTFNGLVFSIQGLDAYVRTFPSSEGARILDGAETTALHYAPLLRNPWRPSRYCLEHPEIATWHYHGVNTNMLFALFALTGNYTFARLGDVFDDDAPFLPASGRIVASPGRTITGYAFTDGGTVVRARAVTFRSRSRWMVDSRRRLPHQGVVLHLRSGPLAGLWVHESTRVYVSGAVAVRKYPQPRVAVVHSGGTAPLAIARNGTTSSAWAHWGGGSSVLVDARARVRGQVMFRLAGGLFPGDWVAEADVRVR